jgi:hypothetical protein
VLGRLDPTRRKSTKRHSGITVPTVGSRARSRRRLRAERSPSECDDVAPSRPRPYIRAMHLDLSDDEAAALIKELHEATVAIAVPLPRTGTRIHNGIIGRARSDGGQGEPLPTRSTSSVALMP